MKSIPMSTTKIKRPTDLGLVEADLSSYQEPLIVGVFGGPGAGKSRLAASAPGAIGLIPTESKSRQTVLKEALRMKKTVILPAINGKETSLIRTANPLMLASLPESCLAQKAGEKPWDVYERMQEKSAEITITSDAPDCCQRHYYRWHVNRVKHVCYAMLEDGRIKSIVIDTFGTLVDDISYANYGTTGVIDAADFGFAPREDLNKEVREFLNNMAQKHLVLTHHAKPVWEDKKPTKKLQIDGKFHKLGHYVSVMVHLLRKDDEDPDDDNYEGKYQLIVKDCQANAELIGQTLLIDKSINFENLALAVYPDSEDDAWT